MSSLMLSLWLSGTVATGEFLLSLVCSVTGVAICAHASRGAEMRTRVPHPPNHCLVQYNIPPVLKRFQILIPK